MERTKYFNLTEPTETQLDYTEDSKVRAILRRQRSLSQMGVDRGFRITVNATNSLLIDVGPGEGYTGGFYKSLNVLGSESGERISTISDSSSGVTDNTNTVTGQALATYANNAKNYVIITYAESEDTPLGEVTVPYDIHQTIVRETFVVSAITESAWNSLTLTQLRNIILVGIVTANGAGTAITASDIQQVVQPKWFPIPTDPVNVTGVSIVSVSQDTLIGAGTLRFTTADNKLYWTAPGDAEGTGVAVTSSTTLELSSDNSSYTITVEVIFAALPAADASDSIAIQSLYGQTIPRYSAQDKAHREMMGTGTPSETNPHALSSDDIAGGLSTHADLFHVNGISRDAQTTQLQCSINAVTDSVLATNLGTTRNSFLIDGTIYDVLTGVPAGTDGVIYFDVLPALTSGDYLIYIDSAGALQRVLIASYVPADAADEDVLWDNSIRIVDMKNTVAGDGTITWDGTDGLTYEAPGDGLAGTPVFMSPATSGPGVLGLSGYYKLYSSNTDNWVIVYVDGSLGIANSSTFTITKDETNHPDESILKLAVVTWNAVGDLLANVRDIRPFLTADLRDPFLEEHDADGNHSKVLQNMFRVHVETAGAIDGRAESSLGIYGSASESAVYGQAFKSRGVIGSASDAEGVYGYAYGVNVGDGTGVYGSARGNTGVMGKANNATGVYGTAVDKGVVGNAEETGVYGTGIVATGVAGQAPATGVFGTATDGVYGVYGSAVSSYGVGGKAAAKIGMYGSAPNTGILANAATNTAVYGVAQVTCGVAGLASTVGVQGIASTQGVYGRASVSYGVYGSAVSTGVYGTAQAAGEKGVFGAGATGVYGQGTADGIFGSGVAHGVHGFALPAADEGTGGKFTGGSVGVYAVGGVGETGLWVSRLIRYDGGKVAGAGGGIASYVEWEVDGSPFKLALYPV